MTPRAAPDPSDRGPQNTACRGFTLVELAIVLVIIGLVIGGILVGQDMVRSAQIRAVVGQIEKLNSATNTFREKFKYLPGDANSAAAQRFGLQTRSGVPGHGDGNGLLEGCSVNATLSGCETTLFWRDLNFARLIAGNYIDALDSLNTAATASDVAAFLPDAQLSRNSRISVYGYRNTNYYQLGDIGSITAGAPAGVASITPIEGYSIDVKMDDGRPNIGTVRAAAAGATYNITTENAGTIPASCADTVDTYATNAANGGGTTPACHLRIRFN